MYSVSSSSRSNDSFRSSTLHLIPPCQFPPSLKDRTQWYKSVRRYKLYPERTLRKSASWSKIKPVTNCYMSRSYDCFEISYASVNLPLVQTMTAASVWSGYILPDFQRSGSTSSAVPVTQPLTTQAPGHLHHCPFFTTLPTPFSFLVRFAE